MGGSMKPIHFRLTALTLLAAVLVVNSCVIPSSARAGGDTTPQQPAPERGGHAFVDLYGDPLPEGAIARMGSVRLRHNHVGRPFSTAFSPDGTILASGGYEEIRLWDAKTGKLVREIKDGKRTTYCVLSFSPDGSRLAGAGLHSTSIWYWKDGRLIREFPVNGQQAAWSPDGTLLASSTRDYSLSVWDVASGTRLASFRPGKSQRGYFHGLQFTPDSKRLITVADKHLSIWDARTGKLAEESEFPVSPGHISPDGKTFVATESMVIRDNASSPYSFWDLATKKVRAKLEGEIPKRGYSTAFSHDSKMLAVNRTDMYQRREDATIALWDVGTGQPIRQLRLPTRYVDKVHFSPDGRTLVTTSTGHRPTIDLWDAVTGKAVFNWPGHTEHVISLVFMPDGRSLVSGGLDGTVRHWDISSGKQIKELGGHRWRCDVVAVTPDGKTILSGGLDGVIRVQDVQGNQLRRLLVDGDPDKHDQPLSQLERLVVSPDGKSVVTWSQNFNRRPPVYRIWDLPTGNVIASRQDNAQVIARPLVSLDGRLAVEAIFQNLRLEPPGAPPAPRWADDGGPTYTGALVREVDTGRELVRWIRNEREFGKILAISPDSRMLITASNHQYRKGQEWFHDNALHIWEMATGAERLKIPFETGQFWFQKAAVAPNGQVLATTDSNGVIQFWDMGTGSALPGRFVADVPCLRSISSLAFSPDSRLLATGPADSTILVWKVPAKVAPDNKTSAKKEELQAWWDDLILDDARRAYRAILALADHPVETLQLACERVQPVQPVRPVEASRLRQLIADLDATQFARREAARKELTALGERAESALRAALAAKPSAEQRRSIEQVLENLHNPPAGESLRMLRALEVLERIGTDEAVDLIKKLAGGVPEAGLTRDAKGALERLQRRSAATKAH